MVKCSIKGCNKQAKVFLKNLKFCTDHAKEIGYVSPKEFDRLVEELLKEEKIGG